MTGIVVGLDWLSGTFAVEALDYVLSALESVLDAERCDGPTAKGYTSSVWVTTHAAVFFAVGDMGTAGRPEAWLDIKGSGCAMMSVEGVAAPVKALRGLSSNVRGWTWRRMIWQREKARGRSLGRPSTAGTSRHSGLSPR